MPQLNRLRHFSYIAEELLLFVLDTRGIMATFAAFLQSFMEVDNNTAAARLVETVTKGIQEKKGRGIIIIDLRGIEGAITQFFVVCQGNSPSQVEAIAESVGTTVREELGEKPTAVAGLGLSHWVAMDFTDVMVHVFVPQMREFYDIEGLWEDAETIQVPDID